MQTFTDDQTRVLRRCPHNRMLGGVAAGAADYLGVDPTGIRIALVLLALLGGFAIPLYLAAWLLIPEEEAEMSLAEKLLRPAAGAGEARPKEPSRTSPAEQAH